MRHLRRRRTTRLEGMSLVEILVVIVIVAVAATGVAFSLGLSDRAKVRSGCTKIAAGARFAYHRAVSQGTTVRMVLDLEQHTLTFEESHGDVVLDRSEDREYDEMEDNAATAPWAAAEARLNDEVVITGRSSFAPIQRDENNAHPDPRYHERGLDGARVLLVSTPHEPEPRETGKAYIYFWPSGRAEHALVQLGDDDGDLVFSVEIEEMTARGQIYPYAFEPEQLEDEEELRDPG